MHLTDVTTSYSRKVNEELKNSNANFIKIFTLGNSTVTFRKRINRKSEIIISNKIRPVTQNEINFVLKQLIPNNIKTTILNENGRIVEIECQF